MIFVTVGDNLPFERLVRAVDHWALANNRDDVFAQIGDTDWAPANIAYCRFLTPEAFSRRIAAATAIISHAGMGTILLALVLDRPILVMPRLLAFREIRNEHQLATARRLRAMDLVNVALNDDELRGMLDRLDAIKSKGKIHDFAGDELLATVQEFITRK